MNHLADFAHRRATQRAWELYAARALAAMRKEADLDNRCDEATLRDAIATLLTPALAVPGAIHAARLYVLAHPIEARRMRDRELGDAGKGVINAILRGQAA